MDVGLGLAPGAGPGHGKGKGLQKPKRRVTRLLQRVAGVGKRLVGRGQARDG